jgi:aldose 1-epimerase
VAVADGDLPLVPPNRGAQVYFNLNANVDGAATVEKHVLTMPTADKVVAVDATLIPTGVFDLVDSPQNAYLDFREGKAIGHDINKGTVTPVGGYDNAWVFAGWSKGTLLSRVATVHSPITGIYVSMSTDQPSVQVYTGNFLNATDPTARIARKKSQCQSPPCYYAYRGAVTLEAQQYPDAVHQSSFPSIVLEPGKVFRQHTVYKFGAGA